MVNPAIVFIKNDAANVVVVTERTKTYRTGILAHSVPVPELRFIFVVPLGWSLAMYMALVVIPVSG